MARYKILIVADDDDQRTLFMLVVTRAGYAADGVPDGESALACLAREHYDLVITDYFLPEMQGDELIHAIRAGGYPVKLVLMSNHVDVRHFARDLTVDGYYTKEDCRQLEKLINRLLPLNPA